MLMVELIEKKRDGLELTTEEIAYFVKGYTSGEIPDYQVSAMLMAMYFRGLTHRETVDLTLEMMNSGETIDLSTVSGIKADKHSTGGVGDKTSLVLCPMVAACGVKMAKISGRGLGHTGGTIDKLESIPGFSCSLSPEQFLSQVDKVGFAIAAQTANVDPADKKMYALRDVTATVPVRGLIVSSIMSKKLAAGADIIVLDVKCGSGSFMKTEEDAKALAQELVSVGKSAERKCAAVITDMDEPLGFAVGNALEVKEAIETLHGNGPKDLTELCLTLGSEILMAGGMADSTESAREMLLNTIKTGSAAAKLREFVAAQGGKPEVVDNVSLLPYAPVQRPVYAETDGFVTHIKAADVGLVSLHLGGGRATKESTIDPAVGIVLCKKVGDIVSAGDCIAIIHAADEISAEKAAEELLKCYIINKTQPTVQQFIKGIVR